MNYAKALSNYLRTKEEMNKREASGYWYPSQMGSCDRSSILQHSGERGNPHDDDTLRNFWLGERIHENLQANVPFELLGSEESARLRDETFKVSGRLDALVRDGNDVVAVEFKSVLEKKFNYELPDPVHVWQVGAYLTFPIWRLDPKFEKHDSECAEPECETPHDKCSKDGPLCEHYIQQPQPDYAQIVYLGKEHAEMREFAIPRSEALSEKVKTELKRLEAIYQIYKDTGRLPDPLPDDHWKIRGPKVYCDFYGTGKCCADGKTRSGDTKRVRGRKPSKV
jgi:hypothetical protein